MPTPQSRFMSHTVPLFARLVVLALCLSPFSSAREAGAVGAGGQVPTVGFTQASSVAHENVTPIRLRIELSDVQGSDVLVPFVATGTAVDPDDFSPGPNPVVILAGTRFADLLLLPVDDALVETPETIVVTLLAPSGATLGPNDTQTVTLLDDDGPHGDRWPGGLEISPWGHDFTPQRVGDPAQVQPFQVVNPQSHPIEFRGLALEGSSGDDFQITYSDSLPITLAPGASTSLQVAFLPLAKDLTQADVRIRQKPGSQKFARPVLRGIALGPPGADILLNAADQAYLDGGGQRWCADYGLLGTSNPVSSLAGISGTLEDDLYRTARSGAAFGYSLPLPDGTYDVIIHAAELVHESPGQRVFDVIIDGSPLLSGIDLVDLVGKEFAWWSPVKRVVVAGGSLKLDFVGTVGKALVAAVEIRSMALVDDDADQLDFGAVDVGSVAQLTLLLTNSGLAPAKVTNLDFVLDGTGYGSGRDFVVRVDNVNYWGGDVSTGYSVDWDVPAGQSVAIPVFFQPTYHDSHFLNLELAGDFGMVEAELLGVGGEPSWGYLHPDLEMDRTIYIDFDGDGFETVGLIGSNSHTHEPGQTLAAFEWQIDGNVFSTDADTVQSVAVGQSLVTLTIWDDKVPPDQASVSAPLDVHALSAVPGILASYFDGTSGGAAALLGASLGPARFAERRLDHQVDLVSGSVGGSGLTSEVLVRAQSDFVLGAAAQVQFDTLGGYGSLVRVDGAVVSGSNSLAAGSHSLEVRWAVADGAQLPLGLTVTVDGSVAVGFDGGLTHSEVGTVPTLHLMTPIGNEIGGNLITLLGFGFFPPDQVVVHWGGIMDFALTDLLSWEDGKLELLSPPGQGKILVSVETPAGLSGALEFEYKPGGPVPIVFDALTDRDVPLTEPTCGVFHPNGKFYVGLLDGRIAELSFDENWYLQGPGIVLHLGVSSLTNFDLCGITVNPYDDPTGPVKLYVGHGEHWLNGGGSFSGPSPFTGQVSVLVGPNFDSPQTLIEGLPTSNHDHGVNGLVFDHNGDLLICMGGNTNAGVNHTAIGDLDESPLSGAILKALTSRSNFNGSVSYLDRVTGSPVTDQVLAENTDVAPGVDVFSFAHGLRNGFNLALTTSGSLYATDNGPNYGFGYESTGPNSDTGSHGNADDELLWIEEGSYYGHPNRSRGFLDPRQYVYRDTLEPESGDFSQHLIELASSVDGVEEYRATTFGGQIRGWLVVQQWDVGQILVELGEEGQSVESTQWISPATDGLNLAVGPGGTIVAVDFSNDRLRFLRPNDAAVGGLTAYDISPWRAPAGGGTPFVIGGVGFVSGQATVTIGGVPAVVTSVTSQRITGLIPALPVNNVDALYDVVVKDGVSTSVIADAFLSLPNDAGNMLGYWRGAPSMGTALAEVVCAVVGTEMFLMGEGLDQTLVYDLVAQKWLAPRSARPFTGDHHACEVWQGKVLLFGGVGTGGAGRVQIYDPSTDIWTLGKNMPWSGGSCSTALIDGLVYVCGGIVNNSTVGNLSVYDPVSNSWDAGGVSLPPMPVPVNHAASQTDGSALWVFGGRGGGNSPQPGYDVVQRFDPATQTWTTSNDPGSPLAPMPMGRGGTGRAVFQRGEFLVLGGESSSAVFDDVQAYDPIGDTWRLEAPMPTARHGIYPVLYKSRLFVAGGGVMAGSSSSGIVEVFRRH
ncbi:MAG TPA: choice-of-anchor D domain-containing protein [Planctomycetes bacterium]|nr:choice-of-anchor D domain-containing protein [Planctomycetota bacterium]